MKDPAPETHTPPASGRSASGRSTAVKPHERGRELLDWLATRFTYRPSEYWAACLAEGRVLLDGQRATGTEILEAGQTISYSPENDTEPPVDKNYRVVANTGGFLFIDKPASLPCHPSGIYLRHSLWYLLKEEGVDARFVNRIDRETSGIVVVATTKEAAAHAACELREGRIEKEYLVIVEGKFPAALDATGWLEADSDSPVRKRRRFILDPSASDCTATATEDAGTRSGPTTRQFSRTLFNLEREASSPSGPLSLLGAHLETGRTHQIRATLSSLGYPVVGDSLYGVDPSIFLRFIEGSKTDSDARALRIGRQALHSARTAFKGLQGERLEAVAPLPQDMSGLFAGNHQATKE